MKVRRKTLQDTQILYRPDPETLLLLKQTSEKVHALFHKVHNLQVEVAEQTKQNKKLTSAILLFLSDPQSQKDAEAIADDLRIHHFKKPE